MAVTRRANLLGQQRIDVPHLRALESAVCYDFDVLAGSILGGNQALVVKGFALATLAPGNPASSLQLTVAGGILLHPLASESGSIFTPAPDRTTETLNTANVRVSGSFTASATNYVGIDLVRAADSTTADLVQFLDPNTNLEDPKDVPLAITLDYVIYVSTQDFSTSPTIAPLAKVVTDASNNIVSIQDARALAFRLGTGGSVPLATSVYPWPYGRTEVGDNSDFAAGDKAVGSFHEWCQATMTRLWELGGGERWYSPTADRNVVMTRSGTTFTNGEWFEWSGTNLHWRGLRFLFDNSTATFNDVANQTADSAGLTNLADGECVYVDVDRTTNRTGGTALTVLKTTLALLGTGTIPGSRHIIAWRTGSVIFTRGSSFPVGTTFNVATNTSLGIVQLTYAAGNPSIPLVAPQDANGMISNTATGGNAAGLTGTGNGTGVGVSGTGGATNGDGLSGTGGATNGRGVKGNGTGTGTGVEGAGGASNGSGVKGTGGATNGIGGQFVGGATAGTGCDVQGGTNGIALNVTANTASNDKPTAKFNNSAGNARAIQDHNGYRMGRTVEYLENWFFTATVTGASTAALAKADWSVSQTANATTTIEQSGSGTPPSLISNASPSACVGFNAGVTNNRVQMATTNALVFPSNLSGITWVAEFEMALNNSVSNIDWFMGLGTTTAGTVANGDHVCGIVKRSANATWELVTNDGVGPPTYTNTAVNAAAGTTIKVKIELHGSASPYGTYTARLFFDDVLKATNTTKMPAAAMKFTVNGTVVNAQSATWSLSPLRLVWNRQATITDN